MSGGPLPEKGVTRPSRLGISERLMMGKRKYGAQSLKDWSSDKGGAFEDWIREKSRKKD